MIVAEEMLQIFIHPPDVQEIEKVLRETNNMKKKD